MTFRDLVESACTGLLQQKLRTLLTIGGVALGSMLLFCSIAGGLGVLDALHNRLSIGDRLLQIQVSSGFLPPKEDLEATLRDQIPAEVSEERRRRLAKVMAIRSARKGNAVPLVLSDLKSILNMDGVQEVTPDLSWRSVIKRNGADWNTAQVRAVQAADASINGLIVIGEGLSGNSANEVLINETFLYSAGIYTDDAVNSITGSEVTLQNVLKRGVMSPAVLQSVNNSVDVREQLLGKADLSNEQRRLVEEELRVFRRRIEAHKQASAATITSSPLKIVGIYRSPDKQGFQANSSLVDAFYSHLLLPADTAATYWGQFNPPNRTVKAKVKAKDSHSAKQIVSDLKQQGFTCVSLADLAMRIRGAVLMVSAIVTAIAGAAFLIAALGMTNTMVMNVLERRREIGILKSIGAKDRDILQMFVTEGLIVGITGGTIGLVLGTIVGTIGSGYIRQFLEHRLSEPIQDPLFVYPLWLVVGTPVLAGLVTVAASFLPARQASRLDPVRTLRSL